MGIILETAFPSIKFVCLYCGLSDILFQLFLGSTSVKGAYVDGKFRMSRSGQKTNLKTLQKKCLYCLHFVKTLLENQK